MGVTGQQPGDTLQPGQFVRNNCDERRLLGVGVHGCSDAQSVTKVAWRRRSASTNAPKALPRCEMAFFSTSVI